SRHADHVVGHGDGVAERKPRRRCAVRAGDLGKLPHAGHQCCALRALDQEYRTLPPSKRVMNFSLRLASFFPLSTEFPACCAKTGHWAKQALRLSREADHST